MTLASSTALVTYVGSSSANQFAFPYALFNQADLVVTVTHTSVTPTVTSTLIIGTDYTVSGLNVTGSPASVSGVVTLVSAGQAWLSGGNLATGYSISIERLVSIVQLASIRNQGDFYPADFENALDYLTMICQQLQAAITALSVSPPAAATTLVIMDTNNGHTYQLQITSGVLNTLELT